MTQPPAQDPADMRASDSDRERVAEALRDAAGEGRLDMTELDQRLDAVYAAKTYAELEPITRDLPQAGKARPTAPVAPAATASPDRFGGKPSSSSAVAIMSGFERKGDWVVPTSFTAVAFMGGGTLDMRSARFAEREVTIHVTAIMGGIEIVVPQDAQVDVTGIGFMGGFDHGASGGGQPGGPVIKVNGFAFWGGVGIKRRPTVPITSQDKLDKLEAKRKRLEAKLERKKHELEHGHDRKKGLEAGLEDH
jgi:hypothetical protein